MDDLIVIILTLVVAVIGIISQRNKKKAAQASPGQAPKQPMDFWDLIMNEENKASQVQQQPYYEEDEVPVIEEQPIVVEVPKRYDFSPEKEGSSEIEDLLKEPIRKPKKIKIEGEEFSLRKAVIYHEILNRKYT